ncbi:cytidine deaminase [Mangrovibacterium diazotrophicum]|uniref:Cytidine deaminase n=1 Tax=Mangrovibacterium diazotrophicum TaxID=1261403 RepID=A0A419VX18_9BACT|nr:cytidine deaminase [Mangrovibacterium diazotrophicum]RKD87704.1 cytidine deaminase [Mangrovibacterium diazotrophicum]
MQTKEIKILVSEYKNEEELITTDRELVLAARRIAESAYAPYSKFKVGAALRLTDGTVVTGSNQENAATPVGTCAERSALFWANANYPDFAVESIAISAIDQSGNRAARLSPCGICRQALLESQHRFQLPIRVILDSRDKIEILNSVESLLPLSFNGNALNSVE